MLRKHTAFGMLGPGFNSLLPDLGSNTRSRTVDSHAVETVDKECSNCGEVKPHGARRLASGEVSARWRCVECQREYSRAHYRMNKHRHNQQRADRTRQRRSEIRSWVAAQKSVPCADCGGRFPSVCMDLDHVRGEKRFNVAQGVYDRTFSEVVEEVAKCDVVCANCHRVRTFL